MSFSVIGGTIPNGCVPPGETGLYGSTADPAVRYAEVATKTGGIIGSICDASFEQTLMRIAQALNTLRRVFPLTLQPIVNSISVTVGGVSVPKDPVHRLAVPGRHQLRRLPGQLRAPARIHRAPRIRLRPPMSSFRAWAPAALLCFFSLAVSGCARSALNPDCPNGYNRPDGGACVCQTDEGCPAGYRCEEAVCVCRGTGCCPEGYEYSTDSEACVCRASECCPKDHRWLPDERRCVCDEPDCCPGGYAFNQLTRACECAGDACCPVGFTWDETKSLCACASDNCCPVDFRYDAQSKDCVCAKTACCPANYEYDAALAACVCVGNSCCPPGFMRGGGNRCVCINDASCAANQICDATTGSCKCTSNAGCPADNFCNSLGYCQSYTSCTSNLDCPGGTFCDITTTRCIPNGPCTLDEQCPLSQICSTATLACRAGCRDDGDCAPKNSCVTGNCSFFCRDSNFCPVNQFCNPMAGTCATRAGRVDCNTCTSGFECGTGASCLTFVTEGQTSSFCGHDCTEDVDCPSGFDCGGVIFGCSNGASCPAPPGGGTATCKSFTVENETGPQFYCSGSNGLPIEYKRSCAPKSGSCPATAAP